MIALKIRILDHDRAVVPTYGTEHSAGLDLYSPEFFVLEMGQTRLLHMGFSMEIPEGNYGMMGPRSGWAIKKGLIVKNAPAIIDSDYRGELIVAVMHIERNGEAIEVQKGDRIAQIAIVPYTRVVVDVSEELSETARGEGGLGSTGT